MTVPDDYDGDHEPAERSRAGPHADYVVCDDCGRTENTVEALDRRPCRDGIPVAGDR